MNFSERKNLILVGKLLSFELFAWVFLKFCLSFFETSKKACFNIVWFNLLWLLNQENIHHSYAMSSWSCVPFCHRSHSDFEEMCILTTQEYTRSTEWRSTGFIFNKLHSHDNRWRNNNKGVVDRVRGIFHWAISPPVGRMCLIFRPLSNLMPPLKSWMSVLKLSEAGITTLAEIQNNCLS